MNKIAFTPLHDEHDIEAFQSGVEPLDNWLRRIAKQHIAKGVSRTYVAVEIDHPAKVLGYYSLTAGEAVSDAWPEEMIKKMPRKLPIVLIGRLACDHRARGQGLGGLLLFDAIQRIVRVSVEIGVALIVVDAKDNQAAAFYEHFGFVPFPDQPMRLAMSVAMAKASLPRPAPAE
jgi:predicted GNAT family N-acyltransferase